MSNKKGLNAEAIASTNPNSVSEGDRCKEILPDEGGVMNRNERGPISEASADLPNPRTTIGKEESGEILADGETMPKEYRAIDLKEAIDQVTEAYINACSTTIKEAGKDFWSFPYTQYSPVLEEGPLRIMATNAPKGELKELADTLTGGIFNSYLEAAKRIPEDYSRAMKAMQSGELLLNGNHWPLVNGVPDIEPIVNRLGEVCFISYEEDGTEITTGEAVERGYIDFSETWAKYAALCTLCSLIGPEELKKALEVHENREEIEALAHVKLSSKSINHAYINRVLDDGLLAIAFGDSYYSMKPESSSSNEEYILTASPKYCMDFFQDMKANSEHAKGICETIAAIKQNEIIEKFRDGKGRIWISENVILREWLRTKRGTVSRPENSKAAKRIVHAAMAMLSSAQVEGTTAAGKPFYLEYFLRASFRSEVVLNGQTVKDVWCLEDHATPIDEYCRKELKAAVWDYPIPDVDRLGVSDVWIHRYVYDILNEARKELYTSGGRKRAGKDRVRILRSWENIFRKAYPLKDKVEPHTKKRIVNDFQRILEAIAKAESQEESHKGKPLYIKAYSERDPGKGKGGGAWKNLVIECSSNKETPEVNL